ncbi:MAG: hypothetical protein WKF79_11915 [Nocardioides sp.]
MTGVTIAVCSYSTDRLKNDAAKRLPSKLPRGAAERDNAAR